MKNRQGLLIDLEQSDGSRPELQLKMLQDRLIQAGFNVSLYTFPRIEAPSAHFIRQYLEGNYGPTGTVDPYTAAILYALDHYDVVPAMQAALANGKIVLTTGFSAFVLATQGIKFRNVEERRGFFIWLDNLEFELFHIPRPDNTIVLDIPDISRSEADLATSFRDLCQLFPKDFSRLDCVRSDQPLPAQDIHRLLWGKVEPLLPAPTTTPATSIVSTHPSSLNMGAKGGHADHDKPPLRPLEGIITNGVGPAYAFTDKLRESALAAALATIPGSLESNTRKFILEQLLETDNAKRILEPATQGRYAQLLPLHMVIEHTSQLLLEAMYQARTLVVLPQATASASSFTYQVPKRLDETTKRFYVQTMDRINGTRKHISQALSSHPTCAPEIRDAILTTLLPLAAETNTVTSGPGDAFKSLEAICRQHDLPEVQRLGKTVTAEIRKVLPMTDWPPDITKQASGTGNIIRSFAEKNLPQNYSATTESVILLSASPRNEQEVISSLVFKYSDLPAPEIQTAVDLLPFDRKLELLQAYLAESDQKSTGNLDSITYTWDITTDYATYRQLLASGQYRTITRQTITPRLGYAVPPISDELGIADDYERCFDLSLELHSRLQAAGYNAEAAYAVLFGHRLRFVWVASAKHVMNFILASSQNVQLQQFVTVLLDKLAEVHPMIGNHMQAQWQTPSITEQEVATLKLATPNVLDPIQPGKTQ